MTISKPSLYFFFFFGVVQQVARNFESQLSMSFALTQISKVLVTMDPNVYGEESSVTLACCPAILCYMIYTQASMFFPSLKVSGL